MYKPVENDYLQKKNLILVFILVTSGIVFASVLYMFNYRQVVHRESGRQLEAIVHLKIREIVHWRAERLGDASLFLKNRNFSGLTVRFLKNPGDHDARRRMIIWMEKTNSAYRYNMIGLYDYKFRYRLCFPGNGKMEAPSFFYKHKEELNAGHIVFKDFYRDEYDKKIYMMIIVPVFDEFSAGELAGIFTLRIDPQEHLYPCILYWPFSTESAETILARREGDSAVYLNELRFKKDSALSFRLPLTQTDAPVVKAALGYEGIVECIDYRGTKVLACINKVPDTPWLLVERIDKAEVYAPFVNRLFTVIFINILIITGCGITIMLFYKQHKIQMYLRQLKNSRLLRESEKEKLIFSAALEQSLNEIFLFDMETFRFRSVNKGGRENTGYSLEELQNMTPMNLNTKFSHEQLEEITRPLLDGEEEMVSFFTKFMRKNNSIYPVQINLSLNRDEKVFIATVIDITSSRQMVKTLEESTLLFQTLINTIPDLIWLKDPNGVYLLCNPMFERFVNAREAGITGKTDYDFVDEELADFFRENDRKAMEAGKPSINEEWITFADNGERALLETIKTPMVDKKGNLVGVLGIARNITERYLSSVALKKREEHYRLLFEQNPAPMLIYEKATLVLLAVNDAFKWHYGYTTQDISRMKLVDLYPEEEKKTITSLAYELNGYGDVGEWHHLRKDGSLITIVASSNDLRFEGHNARVAVITDITAMKLMEMKIRDSEERYRLIFENMTDAFLLTDAEGYILSINPAGCRMFGRSEQDIYAIGRKGMFDNTDSRLAEGLVTRSETGFFEGELRGIRSSGDKFPIMVSSLQFADSKSAVKTATIIRDITESKFAFDLLNTRLELINYSEDHSIDELMIKALDDVEKLTGSLISFFHFLEEDQETLSLQAWSTNTSQKFCKAEGKGMHYDLANAGVWIDCIKEKKAVIHNDYMALIHKKGLPEGHAPVIRELVTPIIRNEKIKAILGVGNKVSEYNEKDLSVTYYLAGVVWDTIARKQSENELKLLNAELEDRVARRTVELEKANQYLEAFSYSVSHDLRAPLRHIRGFMGLLKNETDEILNEKGKHYLDAINTSALRMGKLIEDLLSFSRMGRASFSKQRVNMESLLDDVLNESAEDTQPDAVSINRMPLPEVTGDRAMLRVVLVNLISNAVKFTSKRAEPVIEIGCTTADGIHTFYIRDNGAGFDTRYADKLFGVFQRLHNEQDFPGTGIGLAIVKGIIDRHKGRVWAESESEKGACFYFTLPQAVQ